MDNKVEKTLCDVAFDVLSRSDVEKEEIVAILNKYRESVRKDDPIYGFMLQLECVQQAVNIMARQRNAQDEVVLLQIKDELERHRRELNEISTRALVSQRQQFRRLVAMQREKRLARALFLAAALLLAFLSGLGVFYVYKSFAGSMPHKKVAAHVELSFSRLA